MPTDSVFDSGLPAGLGQVRSAVFVQRKETFQEVRAGKGTTTEFFIK